MQARGPGGGHWLAQQADWDQAQPRHLAGQTDLGSRDATSHWHSSKLSFPFYRTMLGNLTSLFRARSLH